MCLRAVQYFDILKVKNALLHFVNYVTVPKVFYYILLCVYNHSHACYMFPSCYMMASTKHMQFHSVDCSR